MKFALSAVGSGSTANPEPLAQVACRAEELGFESVWIPEHLAIPRQFESRYPYSPDGKFPGGNNAKVHDPLIALTYVAALTKRIRLGTGVFILPLRNTLAVAKAVASLDVLSNGRFLFGVGIGWLSEEFDAVGMPFADRAPRAREAIRVMKALWSDEEPEFEGRFHHFPKIGFHPKPVQKPHPPLIFGGESEAALKRAAALGDGWYGTQFSPDRLRPIVDRLRTLCEAAGRDFSRFEITTGVARDVTLDRDTVHRFADAGAHRLMVLAPGFVPRARFETELFPRMQWIADELIAKA